MFYQYTSSSFYTFEAESWRGVAGNLARSHWLPDMTQQCFTGWHLGWALGLGLPLLLLLCLSILVQSPIFCLIQFRSPMMQCSKPGTEGLAARYDQEKCFTGWHLGWALGLGLPLLLFLCLGIPLLPALLLFFTLSTPETLHGVAGSLAQRALAARHDQAMFHRLASGVGSAVGAAPPALPLPWHPCLAATLHLILKNKSYVSCRKPGAEGIGCQT